MSLLPCFSLGVPGLQTVFFMYAQYTSPSYYFTGLLILLPFFFFFFLRTFGRLCLILDNPSKCHENKIKHKHIRFLGNSGLIRIDQFWSFHFMKVFPKKKLWILLKATHDEKNEVCARKCSDVGSLLWMHGKCELHWKTEMNRWLDTW